MSDKKKPASKPATPPKLSDDEAAKVKGGLLNRGPIGGGGGQTFKTSDECKATTDTGILGCPG